MPASEERAPTQRRIRRRNPVGARPTQRQNTPFPLERSSPASFKRLLGSTFHAPYDGRRAARHHSAPSPAIATSNDAASRPKRSSASQRGARTAAAATTKTKLSRRTAI